MKPEIRQQIYLRYNGHCSYCGKAIEYKDMQVDHAFPKYIDKMLKLGYNFSDDVMKQKPDNIEHIDNLMPSCRRCNFYKSGCTIEYLRRQILTIHERVSKPFISKVAIDYSIIEVKPFDGKFYFEKINNL